MLSDNVLEVFTSAVTTVPGACNFLPVEGPEEDQGGILGGPLHEPQGRRGSRDHGTLHRLGKCTVCGVGVHVLCWGRGGGAAVHRAGNGFKAHDEDM